MNLSDLFKRIFGKQNAPSAAENVIPASESVGKPSLSDLLPFPYREIPKAKSAELLSLWQAAHKAGVCPLLIAADEQFTEMIESNAWEYNALPDLGEFYETARTDLEDDEFSHLILGNEGDEGEAMDELYSPSMDDSPILLAEIPAEHPWDIFRLLPIGGWNDCPDASYIAAFCKEMFERYGVRPVFVSGDMLIVKPERLPAKEEAYHLAWKLYAFCPDMVTQGLGSLHALADSLTKSALWQFWWD